MSSTVRHRGMHPGDDRRFAPAAVQRLREAAGDQAWLLSRGYPERSALELCGNRFRLDARQRAAIWRSVCADDVLERRRRHRLGADASCPEVWIDGHNLLTTLETLLGGGVVLLGRDGCARDLSGVHGTWRRVAETAPGLELAGRTLAARGARRCRWLLDAPVSNSGRLAACVRRTAREHGWDWSVEVVASPDPVLAAAAAPVASSDGWILDRCGRWLDLAGEIARAHAGGFVVDLG